MKLLSRTAQAPNQASRGSDLPAACQELQRRAPTRGPFCCPRSLPSQSTRSRAALSLPFTIQPRTDRKERPYMGSAAGMDRQPRRRHQAEKSRSRRRLRPRSALRDRHLRKRQSLLCRRSSNLLQQNVDALRTRLQGDLTASETGVQTIRACEVKITRARFPWVDATIEHHGDNITLDYAKTPAARETLRRIAKPAPSPSASRRMTACMSPTRLPPSPPSTGNPTPSPAASRRCSSRPSKPSRPKGLALDPERRRLSSAQTQPCAAPATSRRPRRPGGRCDRLQSTSSVPSA